MATIPPKTVSAASASIPADAAGAVDGALHDLRSAIGDAACDRDEQCHTVGVGAKPCGGPQGYLGWSDRGADGRQVAALAARLSALQKAQNERSGLLSNCQFAPDPGAVCRPRSTDGQLSCQTGARRGTSAI